MSRRTFCVSYDGYCSVVKQQVCCRMTLLKTHACNKEHYCPGGVSTNKNCMLTSCSIKFVGLFSQLPCYEIEKTSASGAFFWFVIVLHRVTQKLVLMDSNGHLSPHSKWPQPIYTPSQWGNYHHSMFHNPTAAVNLFHVGKQYLTFCKAEAAVTHNLIGRKIISNVKHSDARNSLPI